MWKFGYVQIIDAPITIIRRESDDILTDFESRLVSEEYRSHESTCECHYARVT